MIADFFHIEAFHGRPLRAFAMLPPAYDTENASIRIRYATAIERCLSPPLSPRHIALHALRASHAMLFFTHLLCA